MKLRHKRSGVELEGRFTRCAQWPGGNEYFCSIDPLHINENKSRYNTSEWEAVQPEPVWRDVTHECEAWGGLGAISHKGFSIQNSGYRVRKVVRTELKCGSLQDYAAFIVERSSHDLE